MNNNKKRSTLQRRTLKKKENSQVKRISQSHNNITKEMLNDFAYFLDYVIREKEVIKYILENSEVVYNSKGKQVGLKVSDNAYELIKTENERLHMENLNDDLLLIIICFVEFINNHYSLYNTCYNKETLIAFKTLR